MGVKNNKKKKWGKTTQRKQGQQNETIVKMGKDKLATKNSGVLFKTKFVETHLNRTQALILTLITFLLEVLKLCSLLISLLLLRERFDFKDIVDFFTKTLSK